MTISFPEFPKIARLSRNCTVTEKLDGTNGLIHITEDGEMQVGSRTRWITPGDDNYGFARWAVANKDGLLTLGPGSHYGEWWGLGIQRNYGLKEKRFSLFNTHKWSKTRPECCHVVPVLYEGIFDTTLILATLAHLNAVGSVASRGFMKPEGIVVYHEAARKYFKKTLCKDEEYKGKQV